MSPTLRRALIASVAAGAGGWLAENVLFGPRYSRAFGGAAVPFLPVYAAGGLAVLLVEPSLANAPAPARAAAYGGMSTIIELIACTLDRSVCETRAAASSAAPPAPAARAGAGGCAPPSWDYGEGACVDLPHALLWSLLGLAGEELARRIP